ncbi:MAG TPA: hypothetical protein VK892_09335 [Pyrinomonadaceae bacterium]|nr:hypothetical protein [Pyrinomonadaceae bacterium]
MKKQILIAIAIIAFLNAWATVNVSAQSGKAVKVKIEFDFQIKDKTFSAGEYFIEAVSRTNDNAFVIKSAGKDKNQIIIGNHLYAGKIQPAKLVFERRGTHYFLTGIFLESGQWGLSVPVSRKRSVGNIASVPSETVELPLSK